MHFMRDNAVLENRSDRGVVMHKVLLTILFFVSLASSAADVFQRYEPRQFKLADRLELDATISEYPIWNGEGKWRLYDIKRWESGGTAAPVPMGTVKVFQTENKKLLATMTVSANLAQGPSNDWTDEPCKREDMLFKASLGGKFKNINCVTINHIADYGRNPGGKDADLYALFVSEGIDIVPTVLRITFTRYSDSSRRLEVVLTINPEVAGFPRATESWGRNPWHKSQAFNDPAKKKFIDALGVWAVSFAKQMDDAFEKKSDAYRSIPSWRSVMDTSFSAEASKSHSALD
jgi:hypothetical protein